MSEDYYNTILKLNQPRSAWLSIVAVSIEAVALFPWYTFLNMIISESILFPIIDA